MNGYGRNLLTAEQIQAVPCPKCGVAAGEACREMVGRGRNHQERVKAARGDMSARRGKTKT